MNDIYRGLIPLKLKFSQKIDFKHFRVIKFLFAMCNFEFKCREGLLKSELEGFFELCKGSGLCFYCIILYNEELIVRIPL